MKNFKYNFETSLALFAVLFLCKFEVQAGEAGEISWANSHSGPRVLILTTKETPEISSNGYYDSNTADKYGDKFTSRRTEALTTALIDDCKSRVKREVERIKAEMRRINSLTVREIRDDIFFPGVESYINGFPSTIPREALDRMTGRDLLSYNCKAISIVGDAKRIQTKSQTSTSYTYNLIFGSSREDVNVYYDYFPAMKIKVECLERTLEEKFLYSGARNCEVNPNPSCTREFLGRASGINTTFADFAIPEALCQRGSN